MSAHVGKRLWSQFWEAARPFAASSSRPQSGLFSSSWSRYAQSPCVASARRPFSNICQGTFRLPKSSRYATTRSFASTGFLLYGVSPANSSPATISSYSTALSKSHHNASRSISSRISCFIKVSWCQGLHTSSKRRNRAGLRRMKTSSVQGQNGRRTVQTGKPNAKDTKKTPETTDNHSSQSYLHIPKNLHRPTKEELLAAATGFWSRLKVRFKWFSIRSVRPWNIDDWSAFVSWILLGHLVWILVGTTTFFSIVILTINTVAAQETLARWVGDYLTQSAGVKVVFESAIVPKWGDGVITFRNVFVSRRPGHGKTKFSKGSSTTAAAAAAAEREAGTDTSREDEDTNYTQFDLTIDTVNITLSFVKWWGGRGILGDVEVKGVRGVVDRTYVHWDGEVLDPKSYRHEHNPGDFEIDSFKLEDLLVTVYQPNGFRPFPVSIFTCELSQLRKQWLFYDFMSANNMSGSFDGSLFTIHPRQSPNYAGMAVDSAEEYAWKKHNRLRIDGLKIDHLNRGVEGPFSWIVEGNVDLVADVMFPADPDESIMQVMADFYDRLEAAVTSKRYLKILENNPNVADLNTKEFRASIAEKMQQQHDKRFLVMDLRVNLNDVRAAVPLLTSDLSYINSALIRPIVAYINSRQTQIPIKCRIVKRASDFDGSWTVFDSGLMDDLSAETYDAFAKNVVDRQARMRRLKKVGLWSASLAIQALFMGMAGNVA